MTVTLDGALVPPGPVQMIVKVVLLVRLVRVSEPLADFVPVQPLLAAHDVAFVDVQLSRVKLPDGTVEGDATKVTVGGGALVTLTVAVALAGPKGPVHTRVKVVVAVNVTF